MFQQTVTLQSAVAMALVSVLTRHVGVSVKSLGSELTVLTVYLLLSAPLKCCIITGCGNTTLTEFGGPINDGSYPYRINRNMHCEWIVVPDFPVESITITFERLDNFGYGFIIHWVNRFSQDNFTQLVEGYPSALLPGPLSFNATSFNITWIVPPLPDYEGHGWAISFQSTGKLLRKICQLTAL
jgi:hypothetical protein